MIIQEGPVLGRQAGRSSRLAKAGIRFWFLSYSSRPESRNKTMISGGKVQLKEAEQEKKGGKGVSVCE